MRFPSLAICLVALVTATVTGATPPPNDACGSAVVIDSAAFADTADTSDATTDADDLIPSCACTPNSHSVWYSFTPSTDLTVTIDTNGSTYDTVLEVFAGSCSAKRPVTCNDDFVGRQSSVTFTACAGRVYLVAASSYCSLAGGNLDLTLRATPAIAADNDGDGLSDCEDNCPFTFNADQRDTDGDGIGELCDNCPLVPNPRQADGDFDGIGDACDACVGRGAADTDGDGRCDGEDNCPSVANPDQSDSDFDGIGDACDACVGRGASDTDGDGRCDGEESCPHVANPDQSDSDFDGIGEACDACVGRGAADTDGDGRCDDEDNCPSVPNPDQSDRDLDGIGDACDPCPGDLSFIDFDGDGFCSNLALCPAGCDNCAFIFNRDQRDADGDGIGDLCDNCPFVPNPDQADGDFDGIGDACDNCPTIPNRDQADSDCDGTGDACERGTLFTLVQTLQATTPHGGARFGSAAAISVSLGTALVGAPFEDINGAQQAGAAYVFDVQTGTPEFPVMKQVPVTGDRLGSDR